MIYIVMWFYCVIRCDNFGWEFLVNRIIGYFCFGFKVILFDIWFVLVLFFFQYGFVILIFDKYNDENLSKIDLYENVLIYIKLK